MAHSHEHHKHEEHHHEHHHEHGNLRRSLLLIVASAILLAVAVYIEHHTQWQTWQLLLVYLVPYFLVGHHTLKEAAEGLLHAQPFDEHLLMSVATLGALAIGFMPGAETEFAEAVFVMLFYQVGELFEGYAEGRSRDSISHLLSIKPDSARVVRNGEELVVAPSEVALGEVIVVRPGDKVALDGIIVNGSSSLNTVALTGESMPRDVAEGDEVVSGCINLSAVLRVRTTRTADDSTVSRIISLMQEAAQKKSRTETFITRFARVYTPVVVFAALLLALLPPLFSASFIDSFPTWLHRALIFLVVSCPCALVLSVPLTFFSGMGAASRRGILVKGSNYLDVLSHVRTVVLDKTGTLTKGVFAVEAVHPEETDERQLLHLAAHVEHFSSHPIGAALRDAFPDEATDGCTVSDVQEHAGRGIIAMVAGRRVAVGNTLLMDDEGAKWHDCEMHGTVIHVAIDGRYAGHIVINDQVKEDAAEAVAALHDLGVTHAVMLTGDRQEVARRVAERVGIDEWHAELLPQDKVEHVRRLSHDSQDGMLAFVGDGINDAPSLAMADVGIGMGGLGSDAAIQAADVVIMDDKPTRLPLAIRIARRTLGIARQNVALALGIKLAVLLLAAVGLATMWMAVFADVGVTVIATLNAMRALMVKEG